MGCPTISLERTPTDPPQNCALRKSSVRSGCSASPYGEHEVSIEIDSRVVFGESPPRALRLVLEWAELHREELLENWELARQGQPLIRIAPLE